jgi:hypothetical protein
MGRTTMGSTKIGRVEYGIQPRQNFEIPQTRTGTVECCVSLYLAAYLFFLSCGKPSRL